MLCCSPLHPDLLPCVMFKVQSCREVLEACGQFHVLWHWTSKVVEALKSGGVSHLIQILVCGKQISRTHKTDNTLKGYHTIYCNLSCNLKSDTRNYCKKPTQWLNIYVNIYMLLKVALLNFLNNSHLQIEECGNNVGI